MPELYSVRTNMRILIVHSIYRPYKKGGAEVVVERFVDELKKRHEVIVLTTEKKESRIKNRESRESNAPENSLAKEFSPLKVREGITLPQKSYRGVIISNEDGVVVIRFVPFNIFSVHDIEQKLFLLRLIWHALDVWNVHSWFVMRRVLKTYQPDVVWTHTLKGIGYLPMKAIESWKKKNTFVIPVKTGIQKETAKTNRFFVFLFLLFGSRARPSQPELLWRSWLKARDDKGGRKWILTPHNEEYVYQFGYGQPPFRIGWLERFTMFFTRWFTKSVDTVLAPSKQIIELHEKYGFWKQAEKISLWPCFVEKKNLPLSSPPLTKGGTNSPVECLSGVFTFGFIGQIEEHKGIKKLVKSFQSYQNPHVRLFVAGRGNLVRWVQEQTKIDSRIEFYGEYRQDELEKLFSKISVLVVPSLIRDNMPTVILEAFAHSRPVIGSALGGISEILGFQDRYCEEATDEAISGFARSNGIASQSLAMTQKGLLLNGFEEKDFHEAFDEIQKPEVYQKLIDNIRAWKPVTIGEVLEKIRL